MRAIVLSWIAGGLLGVVSLAQGQEKPAPLPLPPHNALWNPHRPTPDNPPLRVKVLVLNYDPLVPSEQHRRLSDLFKWGSPERLATRYKAEMEFASGGFLTFEIVEWRNLNEIYAQRDGYRYTPEEYTFNRRKEGGWHDGGGADYPRLLMEQGVPALVDAGVIDEVWVFSDHYFGLFEASMAGPGAFFINGGVYPEVPSRRPFALYGFNYERGVAEMMHNTCHRTEATLNRVYGQWNLKEPRTNWDKFSANDTDSNGAAGVGTCHFPANALQGYDYGNERVVESWADDFLNYPNLTFTKKPVSRETWLRQGEIANQTNHHVNYMSWYFAHVPRAAGVNADGKQNNWWKYMMDFQNYTRDGQPQPLSARGGLRDMFVPRGDDCRFTVAYSGATPVDVSSIDGNDVEVTGPGGDRQAARFVEVSDRRNQTHVIATYSLAAPAGGWTASHAGRFRVAVRPNEVRDVQGHALAAVELGSFEARPANFESLRAEIGWLKVPVAGTNRAQITGLAAGGAEQDLTSHVTWTSAAPGTATVDATGLLRGHLAGTTTITASLGSLKESIAVVVEESGGPGAVLEKAPHPGGENSTYEFQVQYNAHEPLAIGTIGFGDVRVSGPDGFQQFAEMTTLVSTPDMRTATATYRIAPWGGRWWTRNNGVYTLEIKGWQVGDVKARYAEESVLGSFTIQVDEVEPAESRPPTTPPGGNLPSRRPKNAGKKKPAAQ